MSRAFVKEDGNDLAPLPDLPISQAPNYVTATGLAQLHSRLAETQARLAALRARAERLDKMPEAAAERDIRYLESRLRSAILVAPQPTQSVAFGHKITCADEDGQTHIFAIVGEDQADAAQGLIAPHAPLARALMGAGLGDQVIWRKPSGAVALTVLEIAAID